MTKRITALILVLLLTLPLLLACTTDPPEVPDVTYGDSDTESDSVSSSTDSESTSGETEETASSKLKLIEDGKPLFTVIYASTLSFDAQDEIIWRLSSLEHSLGVTIFCRKDTLYQPSGTEILIGNTNRPESALSAKSVRTDEWEIAVSETSDSITVLGGSEEKTLEAFDALLSLLFDEKTDLLEVEHSTVLDGSYASYPLRVLTVEGVNIVDFTVVVPQSPDLSTYYAALNLIDYLDLNMGLSLPLVYDDQAPTDHEILVGDVNREIAENTLTLSPGEFLLMESDGDLIMQGEGIWVGAAVGCFINTYLEPHIDRSREEGAAVHVNDLPSTPQKQTHSFPKTYKNAILMIGDGMGFNHINLMLNAGYSEFVAQQLPNQGSAITRSQSVINGNAGYTDSAAGATALSTGYKTLNGYLGLDHTGASKQNVRELAQLYGAQTAVITTDVITGATPSGFLCHNNSRDNTSQLQADINALISGGYVDYCMGSVDNDLTLETRKALRTISDTDAPFFLMVEEGYIDKYSHNGDKNNAIRTMVRFNDVVAYVIQFVFCHPDTALIVTADHETGGLTQNPSASSYGYSFTSGNHTNVDVPVYAFGPGTEYFNGKTVENVLIPRFIAIAFGDDSFGDETYPS